MLLQCFFFRGPVFTTISRVNGYKYTNLNMNDRELSGHCKCRITHEICTRCLCSFNGRLYHSFGFVERSCRCSPWYFHRIFDDRDCKCATDAIMKDIAKCCLVNQKKNKTRPATSVQVLTFFGGGGGVLSIDQNRVAITLLSTFSTYSARSLISSYQNISRGSA